MRPTRTPRLLQSLQTGSRENWQMLAKRKNSYQSQLSHRSLCLWCLVETGRSNLTLFLPFQVQIVRQKKKKGIRSLNCGLCICFQSPIGCRPILPQGQLCLLACPLSCPEDLTWQQSGWRLPRYGRAEIRVASVYFLTGQREQSIRGRQSARMHRLCLSPPNLLSQDL